MRRRLSVLVGALGALAVTATPAWGQPTPAWGQDVSVGHSGWAWGNPQPQGNTLAHLEFNSGTGYAAGEFGTLLRLDPDSTWRGIPTGIRSDIEVLRAVDDDTVIIGAGCFMRRSDDRGETFRRVPFVAREQNCPSGLATFHFPSDHTGYVVLRDGSVSKTTDGGASFSGKREVPGTAAAGGGGAVPRDVFFVNETTGFAIAGGTLFRTIDNADSWTAEAQVPVQLNGVFFPEPGVGYAVGDLGTILKSTDGGETWTSLAAPLEASGDRLTKIRCGSADLCMISTEAGTRVLRTSDGGATITAVPLEWPLLGSSFRTSTSAVSVGEFGETYFWGEETPPGGPVGAPPRRGSARLGEGEELTLSRVRATNERLVHATGNRGRLGRSTDAGRTWTTVIVPTSQNLTDVSFPDAANGFAIDSADALRYTPNGGAQWTPIDTGDVPSVNAIHAVNSNIAILFTARGIYRSTAASDTSGGGTTFEAIDNAKVRRTAFTDFDRTSGAALFAFGPTSIWVSSDRGATWRTVRNPVRGARYRRIDFVSSRVGFALLGDGRVFATRNGGARWTELAATGTNRATDLAFGDARNGYLTLPSWGDNDQAAWVLHTSDGGATWRPQLLSSLSLAAGGLEAPAGRSAFALASGRARGANLFRTETGGDRGDASTITLTASPRRLARTGLVRLTATLAPSVSGARVAVFARSARGTRWTLVADGQTTAGRLVVDTRARATTRYVAQWYGDAERNGDGSPVVTVAVGPRR